VADPLPAPVLVIGIGNDLRGDDAAGLIAARMVAGWGRPGVRVFERRQLVPELVPDIAVAATVVLIDAAVDATAVRFEPVNASMDRTPGLSHGLTFPDLLTLARRLEGAVPAAWEVAIPAAEFGLGSDLSDRCASGLDEALDLLAGRLPR
jgi:hydrogenase maturation protease